MREIDAARHVDMSTAARIAGVTRQAVAQHISRGHVASVKVGVNRLVSLSDVQQLMTRYAMSGRKPKYQEAAARQKAILDRATRMARGLVASFFVVMTKRRNMVDTIKARYRVLIRAAPESRRSGLRAERDREVHKAIASFDATLAQLDQDRNHLFG